MTRRVMVQLGNTAPGHGDTPAASFLDLWRQIDDYFNRQHSQPFIVDQHLDHWYEIRVDVTDTIEFMTSVAALEEDDGILFEKRMRQKRAIDEHPLTSDLEIIIEPVNGTTEPIRYDAVGRFLQQFFLACNLAVPGSCSLYGSRYRSPDDPSIHPPNLSPNLLEDAVHCAVTDQWPTLKNLRFHDTWAWLQSDMLYDTLIANKPHEKAAFVLLRCYEPDLHDPDIILLVAQALEALMDCGRENIIKTLRERLYLILGKPQTNNKWFSRFYDLRSRIAHGDRPMLRTGFVHPDADPQVNNTCWHIANR